MSYQHQIGRASKCRLLVFKVSDLLACIVRYCFMSNLVENNYLFRGKTIFTTNVRKILIFLWLQLVIVNHRVCHSKHAIPNTNLTCHLIQKKTLLRSFLLFRVTFAHKPSYWTHFQQRLLLQVLYPVTFAAVSSVPTKSWFVGTLSVVIRGVVMTTMQTFLTFVNTER